MEPKIKLGDTVRRSEFVDCFGVQHDISPQLTVTRIIFIEPSIGPNPLPGYYRIYAEYNLGSYEGAERFFEKLRP